MIISYDTELELLKIELTPGTHRQLIWNESETYASAHDPVRGRVGAVVVPHPTKKPLYIEGLEGGRGEVVIHLRRRPYDNTVRLDSTVSLDFDVRGIVTAVRVVR
jgi:hypothetical protein